MSPRPQSLLLVALLAAAVGAAHGSGGTAVTKANFYDVVLDDPNLWLVEYMSPRCGTCQEMSPVWQEFVSKNSDKAKFGQVDIDDTDGMSLAQEQGVLEEGIPSIWLYDRAAGDATKVWGAFDVPTVSELEEIIFGNHLKDAVKGAKGLLAKKE